MITYHSIRACLDQLLSAIRSFTLLCDHSRSKTRLIAIMNLIAKLGMIYATACHASLYATALDCLSVSCHCHRTALTTISWGISSHLQQQLALWVCVKCYATNCYQKYSLLSFSARQSYAHCCSLPSPSTVTDQLSATVHPH